MWRFFLQKQLFFFYLPLEVLEGSACKHIFIKLQLSFLVCSALQAHSALGHFLVRRSHRQRSRRSEHHHGIFDMNRSYFNVPDDYFQSSESLKELKHETTEICQMSSLSCGLRAVRNITSWLGFRRLTLTSVMGPQLRWLCRMRSPGSASASAAAAQI